MDSKSSSLRYCAGWTGEAPARFHKPYDIGAIPIPAKALSYNGSMPGSQLGDTGSSPVSATRAPVDQKQVATLSR